MRDPDLDRLLRAASQAPDEAPAEMPFGFDSRVLARARGERRAPGGDVWKLVRLFRRITTAGAIIAVCAGAAAFWQLRDSDELDETTANAYAMADTVIETAAWQ
jgi:anti-sigma-K factor RskA